MVGDTTRAHHLLGRQRAGLQVSQALQSKAAVVVVAGPKGVGRSAFLRTIIETFPSYGLEPVDDLMDVVGRSTGDAPVMVVDDLQAHPDRQAIVEAVQAGSARVLASVRTGTPHIDAVEQLWRGDLATIVELAPLDRDDVVAMASDWLDGPLDRISLERLHVLTEGLPAHLVALLQAFRAHRWFERRPGGFRSLKAGLPRDDALSQHVDEAFADSSDQSRSLVDLLAAIGPIDVCLLERHIGVGHLDDAQRRRLVRIEEQDDRSIASVESPLVAELTCEQLGREKVAALRSAVAETLRALDPSHQLLDPAIAAIRGRLMASCGPHDRDERVLLRRAVDVALEEGHRDALALAEAQWRHVGDANAALAYSLALDHAGDAEGNLRISRIAEELATTDRDRATAIDRQAGALARLSRSTEATTVIEDGLARVQEPKWQATLAVSHANRLLHAGRVEDVVAQVEPYLSLDSLPSEVALIASLAQVASGRCASGTALALAGIDGVDLDGSDPGMLAGQLLHVVKVVAAQEDGRFSEVDALLQPILDADRHGGNRPLQGWFGVLQGWRHLHTGDITRATSAMRDAVSGFIDVGEPVYMSWAMAGLAAALALGGDRAGARRTVVEHDDLGVDVAELFAPESARMIALVDELDGDLGSATARLIDGAQSAAAGGQWSAMMGCACELARLGSDDPIVEQALRSAGRCDGTLARVRAQLIRSLLGSDFETLLRSIRSVERLGMWWTASALWTEAAMRATSERDRHLAARRAHATRARCPGLRVDIGEPALPVLTPRVREVAERYAAGLTRAEVADSLYLSRRTVDRHLAVAFASLGARRSEDLVEAMADVNAVEAQRRRTPAGPARTIVVTGQWPLRGRESELAMLRDAVSQGARGAVIVGPAGIGKSRLAIDFVEELAMLGWSPVVMRGMAPTVSTLAPLSGLDGHPIALLVDDAPLLEPGVRSAIREAISVERSFMVVTARTTEAPDALDISEPGFVRVDVSGLDRESVRELVADVLGADVVSKTVEALADDVRGNPLLLRESMRAALTEGRLVHLDEGWTLIAPGTSPVMLDLVGNHLTPLSSKARWTLALIVCAGSLPKGVALAASASVAIQELFEADLIDEHLGELHVSHPVYSEAVSKNLTRSERLKAFAALATAASDLTVDPARRALWALDAELEVEPDLLMAGARHAWRLLDLRATHRLAAAASARGAGAEATWLLADSCAASGDPEEADEHLRSLILPTTPASVQVRAALTRSDLALWGAGDAAAALAATNVAVPDEMLDDADRSRLDDQRALIEVATRRRLPAPEDQSSPGAFGMAGLLFVSGRPVSAAARCTQVASAIRDEEGRPLFADALLSLHVECLVEAGDVDEADRVLRSWRPDSTWSMRAGAGRPASAAARMWLRQGRVADAMVLLQQALHDPSATEGSQTWLWIHADLALAAALGGDGARALDELARTERGTSVGVLLDVEQDRAQAWANALVGDPERAASDLVRAAAHYESLRLSTPTLSLLHDAMRISCEDETARSIVEMSDRVEGRLAEARRSHAEAVLARDPSLLVAAGARLADAGAKLAAAEVILDAARALQRRGMATEANDARRAGHALRTSCVGAATPSLRIEDPRLTPRQLEIAQLASTGARSRDIAARLGISVRTVDNQLQRVYDHLGVRGRGELAGALADELTAAPGLDQPV